MTNQLFDVWVLGPPPREGSMSAELEQQIADLQAKVAAAKQAEAAAYKEQHPNQSVEDAIKEVDHLGRQGSLIAAVVAAALQAIYEYFTQQNAPAKVATTNDTGVTANGEPATSEPSASSAG